MKKSNGGLINSLVLIAFSCMSCISLISKTQRNIDPNPILSTQLDENPVVSSTVMKIRNSADTVEKVFRDIEIFRCNTKDEAQQQYDSHKATFMEGGSACRMYRERNTNGNMYYAAYKRIRFDYNHGIPYRVINHPDIWIGFLNGNYFIHISYVSYSEKNHGSNDYKKALNDDIVNVAKFLNEMRINQNNQSSQ